MFYSPYILVFFFTDNSRLIHHKIDEDNTIKHKLEDWCASFFSKVKGEIQSVLITTFVLRNG